MKLLVSVLLLLSSGLVKAEISSDLQKKLIGTGDTVCLFADTPPLGDFHSLQNLKVGKHGYGKVDSLTIWSARYAHESGGNAIIDLYVRQRFGFWPWQIVRPVATGTVIRWPGKTESKCVSLGGRLFLVSDHGAVSDISYAFGGSKVDSDEFFSAGEMSSDSALQSESPNLNPSDITAPLIDPHELKNAGLPTDADSGTDKDWSKYPWTRLEDETRLKQLFRNYSNLVDPFSVEFRQVEVRTLVTEDGSQITTWCGHSNQKNRMGAYGGWANFYAVEGLMDKPVVEVALGDQAEATMLMVSVMCKRSGVDGVPSIPESTISQLDSLLEQIHSSSQETRQRVSMKVFNDGIDDGQLYDEIAVAIKNQLPTLNNQSPRTQQQEVAWHVKALSCSGNQDYLPLLDELSGSSAKTVAKYAKKYRKVLAESKPCN